MYFCPAWLASSHRVEPVRVLFIAYEVLVASGATALMACAFFFSSRRRHTRFKCDWSSDVCSSDLARPRLVRRRDTHRVTERVHLGGEQAEVGHLRGLRESLLRLCACHQRLRAEKLWRSEERRVGKECRSRWSPDH